MDCWNEPDLEEAARQLLDGDVSGELSSLREHAESCARCADLLEGFTAIEEDARRRRSRSEVIVALQSLRGGANGAVPDRTPVDDLEFDQAAETSAGTEARLRLRDTTLVGNDGRFLVRIHHEPEGSSGVLPRCLPGGSPGSLATRAILVAFLPDLAEWIREAGPCLRIGDLDYPFDLDGIARISWPPSGPISLAYRGAIPAVGE